jgi:hypothetical protein
MTAKQVPLDNASPKRQAANHGRTNSQYHHVHVTKITTKALDNVNGTDIKRSLFSTLNTANGNGHKATPTNRLINAWCGAAMAFTLWPSLSNYQSAFEGSSPFSGRPKSILAKSPIRQSNKSIRSTRHCASAITGQRRLWKTSRTILHNIIHQTSAVTTLHIDNWVTPIIIKNRIHVAELADANALQPKRTMKDVVRQAHCNTTSF